MVLRTNTDITPSHHRRRDFETRKKGGVMFIVNGVCRLIIFWIPIAFIQWSHRYYLAEFASFEELGTQIFAYIAMMILFMDTLNPKTEIEIRQTLFAGRTGLFVATILPLLALLGQNFAYEADRESRIDFVLYHSVILITNGVAYYLAFFHWAASPRPAQRFMWVESFIARIKKSGVLRGTWEWFGIFCKWAGMATVGMVAGFIILIQIIDYKTPEEKVYREHSYEASGIASDKAEVIKTEYVAKNCKEMPRKEFSKLKSDIEDAELARIRKGYNEPKK